MSSGDVDRTVREVLETVLGRPISAGEDVVRAAEPKWDSLAHVNLVFAIESELGIQFSADELGALDTVQKLVSASRAHLRAASSPSGSP